MFVSAIILAAGKGERIGQPKWQLVYDGKSFLEIIVTKLVNCGFDDIVCVMSGEVVLPSAISSNVSFAINPVPEEGMLSSVYCGIQAANLKDGCLLFPVDHPFVTEVTIKQLLDGFQNQPDAVICPAYQSKFGHPIIIPGQIAQKINLNYFAKGLSQFLREQNCNVIKIDVADEGILRNINFRKDMK
jgi:CTP:molybdopterin cytidylyltransferase MocA